MFPPPDDNSERERRSTEQYWHLGGHDDLPYVLCSQEGVNCVVGKDKSKQFSYANLRASSRGRQGDEADKSRRRLGGQLLRRLQVFRSATNYFNQELLHLIDLVQALKEIDYVPKALLMPLCIDMPGAQEDLGVRNL